MATDVILPKLGFSMNEGMLAEWCAVDGATVAEGQALFLLESEKSSTEIVAPASGTLRILAAAGAEYEVGTVLGMIE